VRILRFLALKHARLTASLLSWRARAKSIFRATKQHALNLAKFVSIYKTLLLLQRKANGGKERNADTFVAGLIGGYLVFGNRNAVNEQVTSFLAGYPFPRPLTSLNFRSCSTSYRGSSRPSYPGPALHTQSHPRRHRLPAHLFPPTLVISPSSQPYPGVR
jgi:hypothetical protein